jgi:DNA-binding transcriptional ArsR family regulator
MSKYECDLVVLVDKVFKALGDPTRRGILGLLRSGDMSAGSISKEFPITKSTLSGHLNVLKEAKPVVTERQGSTIFYSLNVAVYEEMVGAVIELLRVGAEKKGDGKQPAKEKRNERDAYQPAD